MEQPSDEDMVAVNEMAKQLIIMAQSTPQLALALMFASSNVQAAAAAACPNTPSKSLKSALRYYEKNTRAAFQRFVAKGPNGGKFDA
ncbi:hypothetical protein ROE7235_03743 [Roseibaca ekhonensis]|uniref:Uncharacterized protein n=1 Tax=Roseinatronobacter ekhonensis TaxID=254356 RepID=A0A3B0MDR7_9RHOB|nr:hypothetical protein [Roseibaca ekhonensis]SUZ33962.1 hypothetical protein ROE7235_03743 [Roseibaca ekhonensis]